MTRNFPESDWKLFRQLRSLALERYCQKILDEVARIAADTKGTAHERYLKVCEIIRKRDRDLGDAFDDLRRSTALLQLIGIYALGVVTEDEIARFSPETREIVLGRFT